jgi:hypothetical protein
MKPVFAPSSPQDAPRIAEFLEKAFSTGPGDAIVRPDHMHWKYWEPRADWPGSRSFHLHREGVIVAHGAPWPVPVHTPSGAVLRGAQVLDWAADPSTPGAGLSLMKNIAPELVDVIFALGGSEATRKVLPAFGFKPFNEVWSFARPLRPFAQIATHQYRDWKSPVRLLRNVAWSLKSTTPSRGWSSRPIEANQISSWPETSNGITTLGRDAARFEYFAKCNLIQSQLFLVEREGREAGYFYLVFTPGQARIADAWAADPQKWKEVYALAIAAALTHPGANEITAIAGLDSSQRALEQCGFVRRGTERLMIYDPKKTLDPSARLHFQMIDNDAFFQHSGRPQYDT